MKISPLSSPFSFLLDTKQGEVSVNELGKNLSVFLSEQKKDADNVIHWPGEYERSGVGVFAKDLGGDQFFAKIFAEHIRVVFFADSGMSYSEELKDSFGNTDILILDKGENGLSDGEVKKILEAVEPRVLIGTQGRTMELFKKLSLPIQAKENVSFTKSTLPAEHTEYYIL